MRPWSAAWLTFLLCLLSPLTLAQENSGSRSRVLDPSSMDTSVDPCVDFYTYSCGGWMKKNPIPLDQSSWSVYGKLQDDNRQQLRGILEAASSAAGNRTAVTQKIGDYYASCTDEAAIEKAGVAPLTKQLDVIEKIKTKSQLAETVSAMASNLPLFKYRSHQDYRDSRQVIAEVDQGGLGLPDRDYYFKEDGKSEELRKGYVAHVEKMLTLLGDKPDAAAAGARAVMRIETELAHASITRVERRDPTSLYHKMAMADLEKLSPAFDWKVYFAKVGPQGLESLNVVTPKFFPAMNAQIEKENLATWKAYLRWHLVHANARYLPAAFVNENFDFYGKKLLGAQQLRPRWKRCVEDVDNDLGEALGQAYVEKYFSAEAKRQALRMVKEIETAMQKDIETLPWMSAETKRNALEKLHTVANKVGYPDRWRDYSKLEIVRGDELGNVIRARDFEFRRRLAKIGKPLDRQEWRMTPPTVNAEYDPQRNEINFPAGILQAPLFDVAADAAPNYGDTGGTIGHELTHGFDDEGRQFDAQGNLRNWWTAADGKEFEERAKCISDQYAQYVIIDDIHINSKLTLGEDVADLGGLLLAYNAWKENTKGQKLEPMDGLTPAQRFFVGYGQYWCSNTRNEAKRWRATVDPHSPDKYRASGVVTNMPEFQEAFRCRTGTPMAPANRCRVW